ncbi:DinB family protein [Paenibacillus kobensis]|uniref:DinB family protein n=1 Tax=Paenibacillus kobensis TaxID=59841 RepID=UPI000FD94F7C|nr:DinB family protein [Paenibacillus kobensis]
MIHLSEETILRFKQFTTWTDTLHDVQDSVWRRPVSEGKASVGEIVAHLQQWDDYIITNVIPAVHNGEGMVFPDFDLFNEAAYTYARSGVSQLQLLEEFKHTRLQLVDCLIANYDTAVKPVTANGVSHCPHTGTPYSLLFIIHEFNDHDQHHRNQIMNVLQQKSGSSA